jgi:hypothetical protein
MTFEEILDQAIAMLQRRGRLTYSTLKRQFQLDDAALDDLKNELIEGRRVAVDERGNVLVWTGGTDVSPQIAPPGPQAGAPPDTSDAHRTPSSPAPAAPALPDRPCCAGPCCALHCHRDVPCHGHDLLAPRSRSGPSARRWAMIDDELYPCDACVGL